MQLTTGYENRKARIEMIPLIDVIFLLHTFFIYAMLSMAYLRGLRVELPYGAGRPETPRAITISIAADNSLSVDGQPVTAAEAVQQATQRVGRDRNVVLVSGDRRSDLGVAIELLSALRIARVESVSFQVREAP